MLGRFVTIKPEALKREAGWRDAHVTSDAYTTVAVEQLVGFVYWAYSGDAAKPLQYQVIFPDCPLGQVFRVLEQDVRVLDPANLDDAAQIAAFMLLHSDISILTSHRQTVHFSHRLDEQ
jgi:hypothetical protein